MNMVETWHRRWLREELGRAGDEEGHVTLAEVMALDGWSGWGDRRRRRPGAAVRGCGPGIAPLARALAHGAPGRHGGRRPVRLLRGRRCNRGASTRVGR
jgi:hypothetical protein